MQRDKQYGKSLKDLVRNLKEKFYEIGVGEGLVGMKAKRKTPFKFASSIRCLSSHAFSHN